MAYDCALLEQYISESSQGRLQAVSASEQRGWLPPGLFDYGAELAAGVDVRLGCELAGDGREWIDLPRRLGIAECSSVPVPWGEGALCVDLGPEDGQTWERFAGIRRDEPDPEFVAAAAQEWRLAVTPYRRLSAATVEPSTLAPMREPMSLTSFDGKGLAGKRIVDLTSMWAGPLCTELLGRAGARVDKVTSEARPDGHVDVCGVECTQDCHRHRSPVHDGPPRSRTAARVGRPARHLALTEGMVPWWSPVGSRWV